MEEVLRKYGVQAPESGGPLEWSGEGVEGPTTLGEGEGDDLGETTRWPEVVDEEDEEDEEDVEEDEGEEEEEEDIIGETLEEQERERRRKDLDQRMAGLNIEEADFDEIWERLDPREREEFVLLAQQLDEQEKQGDLLE